MSIDHTITLSEAHHLARRAIAERGADYIYKEHHGVCAYFVGGKPGCMVGLMLSYVGLEKEAVFNRHVNGSSVMSLANTGLVSVESSQATMEFLSLLQGMQDTGSCWGTAYERTAAVYPDPGNYRDPTVPTAEVVKEGEEKPVIVYNPMTNAFEAELTVPTDWVNDTAEAKAKNIEKELIDA